MHRAILAAGFLAATALAWADEAPSRIWVGVDPEATERLHELLLQETISQVDFDETRLAEVLDHLSELIGHQIRIDALALDELGLGPDEPVTIKAKNLRLGAVLQLMLEPLELTCLVQDGLLIVSTEDVALTRCKTAIYPVGDLLIQDEKDGPDYRSLIALITATIASDTWALSGGGEATVWPYPQRAVLVVTTTSGIHEEIGEFLAALRKMPIDPKAKTLSHDDWYAPFGDRSVARGRGGRTGSRGGFGGGGGFGFGGGGGGFGYGGVDEKGAYGGGGGSFSPRAVEEPRPRLVPVVTEK